MARTASPEPRRRIIYVMAGLVAGIAIMVIPALILGPPYGGSLTFAATRESLFEQLLGAPVAAPPLDVAAEVLWLVLPALIIVLALYWLAVHRTRWAGYDEAAKWSRR